MPILNNDDVVTDGSIAVKTDLNPSGVTITQPRAHTIYYREGTGRRDKPKTRDNTPYTLRKLQARAPVGHGDYKTPYGQWLEWSGHVPNYLTTDLPGGLQSPLGFDEDVRLLAMIEALGHLNRKDLDFGTAWAERGKTAQMLGDIASKTVRTINAARKGRGREILDIWGLNHRGARGKGFVDSYLSYHYGVKPFLQDLSGAVQALVRLPANNWRVLVLGKHGYDTTKVTDQIGLGGLAPYECTSTLRQGCKTLIAATQKPLDSSQELKWSLGLDDPLSTAWELTPWSFVLDWAIPIGDWLSARNSLKYYDGWEVVQSQFRKEVCTYSGSNGTVSGIVCSTTLSGGGYEKLDIQRSVSAGPPMFGIPFKDPRSLDHMAKGLALLASTIARGGIPRNVRY